jgi:hypothetical protein
LITKLLCLLSLVAIGLFSDSYAQIESGGFGDSPFERKFGDIKFLDAYFGTLNDKLEVNPGDKNMPFTVIFANVGTQDISGIRGQLSVPFGFSGSDGAGSLILADADSNSLAGENFDLTFFVNVENQVTLGQYPASVKVDYSRLRESGQRNAFADFKFKVTGDTVINMRALDPILTSLQTNHIVIEIVNDGTAPISGVDIQLANTQSERASTTQSVTNVENVVILNSDWDVGSIGAGEKKYLEVDVYIPGTVKGDTLRAPMDITYFNAHGDRHTVSRIVDFYIRGLIDTTIYNIDVIELSGQQTVIGEIINEGNTDALFGFVTLEPLGDSNIVPKTQFIDEVEVDAPVPFNVPIEFDGEPRYGQHDIKITLRYKDDLREEHFVTHETTINLEALQLGEESGFDPTLILLPVIAGIGFLGYRQYKKKQAVEV